MSETPDESQKTEEPTAKKLQDALKKGDVPKSQEIPSWFILGAGTLLLIFYSGPMASQVIESMTPFLARPHILAEDLAHLPELTRDLTYMFISVLWPVFFALIIVGVLSNLIQHPPLLTAEKINPKLDKINPIKGVKRVFGMSALVNFAKGLAKLVIVTGVACFVLWPQRDKLGGTLQLDLVHFFPFVRSLTIELMLGILAVLTLVAILDLIYQKFDHRKKLRMTKQEVKDEHKQLEGDPTVKAKLRQIRAEKGRKRMMAEVPSASVVITNPTHFAVALKYQHGEMNAPTCVAKGADLVAHRIRSLAEENGVPIVENPPLARGLYQTMEVDDEIPPEHYQAVAEVISFVMRQSGAR